MPHSLVFAGIGLLLPHRACMNLGYTAKKLKSFVNRSIHQQLYCHVRPLHSYQKYSFVNSVEFLGWMRENIWTNEKRSPSMLTRSQDWAFKRTREIYALWLTKRVQCVSEDYSTQRGELEADAIFWTGQLPSLHSDFPKVGQWPTGWERGVRSLAKSFSAVVHVKKDGKSRKETSQKTQVTNLKKL